MEARILWFIPQPSLCFRLIMSFWGIFLSVHKLSTWELRGMHRDGGSWLWMLHDSTRFGPLPDPAKMTQIDFLCIFPGRSGLANSGVLWSFLLPVPGDDSKVAQTCRFSGVGGVGALTLAIKTNHLQTPQVRSAFTSLKFLKPSKVGKPLSYL